MVDNESVENVKPSGDSKQKEDVKPLEDSISSEDNELTEDSKKLELNKYEVFTKLDEYGKEKGLDCDKKTFFGEYNGVYVTLKRALEGVKAEFGISGSARSVASMIKNSFNDHKTISLSPWPFRAVNQSSNCITVRFTIKEYVGEETFAESLEFLINTIIDTAFEQGAKPNESCARCNMRTDQIAFYEGRADCLCTECVSEIDELHETYEDNRSKLMSGIGGAVIGAVIGTFPWLIVLLLTNWTIHLLAIFVGIAAIGGYILFDGSRDIKKMRIVLFSVTFLVILSTNFISMTAGFYTTLSTLPVAYRRGLSVGIPFLFGVVKDTFPRFTSDLLSTEILGALGILSLNRYLLDEFTIPDNPLVVRESEML